MAKCYQPPNANRAKDGRAYLDVQSNGKFSKAPMAVDHPRVLSWIRADQSRDHRDCPKLRKLQGRDWTLEACVTVFLWEDPYL